MFAEVLLRGGRVVDVAELPGIPAWMPWAHAVARGLVAFVVSWAVAALAQRVALAPYRRAARGAWALHWAESARLLLPARKTAFFAYIVLTVVFGYGAVVLLPELSGVHRVALVIAAGLGAILGASRGHAALVAAYHDDGRARPTFKTKLASVATSALVLYPVVLVAVPFVALMPSRLDAKGLVWAVLFAAAVHLVVRGGGFRLAAALGLARPPSPALQAMMTELCARMGQPRVEFHVLAMRPVNAFAMPQLRLVAVTASLAERLSLAEIRAVCAHELGHVAERKPVVRARIALIWVVYALLVGLYAMSALGVSALVQLALLLGLFLVKASILSRVLRKAEAHADHHAHEHEGDGGTYAQALEAIYRANRIPAVLSGAGASHPHLYDRMVAAGATPDFPRPAPPPVRRAWGGNAVVALAAFAFFVASEVGAAVFALGESAGRPRALAVMSFVGPTSDVLEALARDAYKTKDYDAAAKLYQASAARRPESALLKVNAALVLAMGGRCTDAAAAMREARSLLAAEAESGPPEVDQEWLLRVQTAVGACGVDDVGH